LGDLEQFGNKSCGLSISGWAAVVWQLIFAFVAFYLIALYKKASLSLTAFSFMV
jgi:hypothetical protein